MTVETGTCIWFKESYGYIGKGVFTNNSYEGQIYAHYKNIDRTTMKDPRYKELKPGDIVEFETGPGFHMDGTQAVKVRVIVHAPED